MPLGATDFAIKKTVCHLFYISSDPAPLNESCPLQASQFYPLLCAESQGPNLYDGFQKALLGNWCQRGRERSHQSLSHQKLITYKGESTKGERILKDPRCLMFKRRDATCLFGGKTCSYELIWIKFYSYLLALIFCFLSSPNIPCKIQGSKTPKGKEISQEISQIHCISLFVGTCWIQCGTLYSLSTCHPSLGSLVASLVCSG